MCGGLEDLEKNAEKLERCEDPPPPKDPLLPASQLGAGPCSRNGRAPRGARPSGVRGSSGTDE